MSTKVWVNDIMYLVDEEVQEHIDDLLSENTKLKSVIKDEAEPKIGELLRANAELKDEVQKWMAAVSECNTAHQNDKAALKEQMKLLQDMNKNHCNHLTEFKALCDKLKMENDTLQDQLTSLQELLKVEGLKSFWDRYKRMAAMLERLEWQDEWADECKWCPDCGNHSLDGHNDNCSLGNLLAEIRKENK